MPTDRDAVARLADDPAARVMVFVDGQNLYKACVQLFGHPLCHPHLLAEYLAGDRTGKRTSCRFYTGRPDPNRPAEKAKARNLDRRLDGISRHGCTVQKRPLRYHWDWGHREELPEPGEGVAGRTVTLHPWERPHEKGIDVLIALDVIEMILLDKCDVAIVVSLDRDLREIPAALRNLGGLINRPYRLEAAVPVATDEGFPKQLSGFNFTHQIGPTLFSAIRDDTDYTTSVNGLGSRPRSIRRLRRPEPPGADPCVRRDLLASFLAAILAATGNEARPFLFLRNQFGRPQRAQVRT